MVPGGEQFSQPILIDSKVKKSIGRLGRLAPLHNPANLFGIEIMELLFPHALQIAVFDTGLS